MKFGPVPPRQAEGATAVHTIRQGSLVLKKGTLIGPAEVAALEAAGIKDVVVARLEPGDVSEDKAAAEIATAVAGQGVHVDRAFTGRANLFAQAPGILVVDKAAIDRLNRVDEAITFATLPAFKPVVEGEMIATVKIIPFATSEASLKAALAAAGKPFIRVAPYTIKKVGVVSTLLPGLATKVVEKTLRVMQDRLTPAPSRREPFCEHADRSAVLLACELAIGPRTTHELVERFFVPFSACDFGGDLLRQHVERLHRHAQAIQLLAAHRVEQCHAFHQIVARYRKQAPLRQAADHVTRAPDTLKQSGYRTRRRDLTHEVHVPDVDAELQGCGSDQRFQLTALQLLLGFEALLARKTAVMRSYLIFAQTLG